MSAGVTIEIVPYDPSWPRHFAQERAHLQQVFPPAAFLIEHVGSTAVPGLGAKPTVDVMIGGPDLAAVEARMPALAGFGYHYLAEVEQEIPERRFFVKPAPRPRRFHVHAVAIDTAFWTDHLYFRDALRADPALAARYCALKQALALRHGDDFASYTRDKTAFIQDVLDRRT